jgi:hypothetical protein
MENEPFISKTDVLYIFEKSMRSVLRKRMCADKTAFTRDMMVVLQYANAIRDGVHLAHDIKTAFEFFLPKIGVEWKITTDYSPVIQCTERYIQALTLHLERQQRLFEEVSVIISSLDMPEEASNLQSSINTTLVPITIEFRLIKILCQLYNVLFKKDREKLEMCIEEFLLEFRLLDEAASTPLSQLKSLLEQLRVVSQMPTQGDLVRKVLQKIIDVAASFIQSFLH